MRARWVWTAAAAWLLLALSAARAQEPETLVDDSAMALAPEERRTTPNPTVDHAAFMDAATAEDISGATELANRLEDARRLAPLDLLWGVGR